MTNTQDEIVLREIVEEDLPIFFEQQSDPDANHMAAFTAKEPTNREAFMAHWARIMANPTVFNRTILYNGDVAGNLLHFTYEDEPKIGYWIGKEYWGKGIASRALAEFLPLIETRPLYARVAKDNIGSIRVLQKGGFVQTGEDSGFSNYRNEETEEYIYTLS
jgi:RimJ/RimL family protein N-acetyltransferase